MLITLRVKHSICIPSRQLNTHTLRAGLHWQREKEVQIDKALGSCPVDIEALRRHAISMGGLFHSHIRKRVWPKLVGVNMYSIKPYEGAPLMSHKDRAQVLLDVNRCTKRMPERENEVLHRIFKLLYV